MIHLRSREVPARRAGYSPSAPAASVGGGFLGGSGLDVEGHGDVVAEHVPAVVEGLVPHDSEVLAVDGGRGLEAVLGVLAGADRAQVGHGKGDLPGDPVHGQVAGDVELVLAGGLDARALEGDLGEL